MNSDGGMDYSREATGSCRAAALYYDREVRATGRCGGRGVPCCSTESWRCEQPAQGSCRARLESACVRRNGNGATAQNAEPRSRGVAETRLSARPRGVGGRRADIEGIPPLQRSCTWSPSAPLCAFGGCGPRGRCCFSQRGRGSFHQGLGLGLGLPARHGRSPPRRGGTAPAAAPRADQHWTAPGRAH